MDIRFTNIRPLLKRGFCFFYKRNGVRNMYKFKKNFLCAGIFDHTSNVILNHTSNVILGFIPRIHTKHSPLDTRDKPEYDDSKRLYFAPEYDNEVVKSVGTSENGNYVAQCGRSMIEMLGVLAIVGVLSVGGIAGYSKAMRMYKSNIQKRMISSMVDKLKKTPR